MGERERRNRNKERKKERGGNKERKKEKVRGVIGLQVTRHPRVTI